MARTASSVEPVANDAIAALTSQARPAGAFDPSRYFRSTVPLQFLNVRTPVVRALGRTLACEHRQLADEHDLIHKATGWLLREAGRTDRPRLERYLLAHGPALPRTTVRYAIEHIPPVRRRELLLATRDAARPDAARHRSAVRPTKRRVFR